MIRLIAAIDSRRGIATDSGIPWRLPGDTAYFHDKTATGLILMGWATYNEFAAPLHDRENFVLTAESGSYERALEPSAVSTNWRPRVLTTTCGSSAVPLSMRRRSRRPTDCC